MVLYSGLTIVIAQKFGAEVRGSLAIYNTSLNLLSLICGVGLSSSIIYHTRQKLAKPSTLIKASVLWSTAIACTLVVIAISVPEHLCSYLTGTHSTVIPTLLAVHIAACVLYNLSSALLAARGRFVEPLVVLSVQCILSFVLLYGYHNEIIKGSSSEQTAIFIIRLLAWAYIVPAVLFYLYTVWYSYRVQGFSTKTMQWASLLKYATKNFLGNIVQTLVVRMDIWLLYWLGQDTFTIGAYSIAALAVQMWWIAPNQAASLYFAKASGHSHISVKAVQLCSCALLYYSIAALTLSLPLLHYCVPVILGKDFSESVPYFALLIIGASANAAGLLLSSWNAAQNTIWVNIQGSVIAFAICLIAYPLCIPKFGAYSAAIISSIAYCSTTLYYFAHFAKTQGCSIAGFIVPKQLSPSAVRAAWQEIMQ
jgi:O-antigen/teichoic acid export membrane protein